MKRYFFVIFLGGIFVVMLALPDTVFGGASQGLLLWFNTVLPTLFPFLIITGLLIRTHAVNLISAAAGPVLGPLFGISPNASFAVLGGFLCGYPMGAKIASDLVTEGHIEHREGAYLLSFCNNTSPMFILSYVVWQSLEDKSLALPSILILYASPVLSSFLFRRFYRHRAVHSGQREVLHSDNHCSTANSPGNKDSFLKILDQCIMDSCETITKVGGYIIVFSILLALLQTLPVNSLLWNGILLPSMEITAGVKMTAGTMFAFPLRYVLTMALTSFGGLCAAFQTQCMVQKSDFPMLPYIIEKLITAMVTSLFALLYIQFCR